LQVSTNAGSGDIVKILHDGDTYFAEINGTQYRDRPLVRIGASTTTPALGASVTFTNATLGPRTGSIWDFGDGTILTNNAETVTRSYTNAATFTVSLVALGRVADSTATNSVTVTDPQYAVQFDGANYVSTTLPAETLAQWTVEFWLNAGAYTGDARLIAKTAGDGLWVLLANTSTPNLFVVASHSTANGWQEVGVSDVAVVDETWRHVAAVCDGTTVKLYRDGALMGSGSAFELVLGGTQTFGSEAGNAGVTGSLDELRISSVARYNGAFTPPSHHTLDSDTIAYWRFNDGDGTTLSDATGNHNGTLQGGPLPQWVAGKE
jgi:hypothetical protein